MTPPPATARDLTKNYKGKKVLTGLDFELGEGRIHGLLGHNGIAGAVRVLVRRSGLAALRVA